MNDHQKSKQDTLRELLETHVPQELLIKLVEECKLLEAWTVSSGGKQAQIDYLCSMRMNPADLLALLARRFDKVEKG